MSGINANARLFQLLLTSAWSSQMKLCCLERKILVVSIISYTMRIDFISLPIPKVCSIKFTKKGKNCWLLENFPPYLRSLLFLPQFPSSFGLLLANWWIFSSANEVSALIVSFFGVPFLHQSQFGWELRVKIQQSCWNFWGKNFEAFSRYLGELYSIF